jgi:hypothetical protein
MLVAFIRTGEYSSSSSEKTSADAACTGTTRERNRINESQVQLTWNFLHTMRIVKWFDVERAKAKRLSKAMIKTNLTQ